MELVVRKHSIWLYSDSMEIGVQNIQFEYIESDVWRKTENIQFDCIENNASKLERI